METVGYIAAIGMGIALGMVGGGGSILTVPILLYFFKYEAMAAATASLFIVGTTAFAGGLINSFKKNIDFKTGLIFAIPSFLGVLLIRKFVLPLLPEILVAEFTLLFFAMLMVFSAKAMIQAKTLAQPIENPMNKLASVMIFAKGFFIGCITGFVGAGGGFLIVPALTLFFGLSMKRAVGTSLVIISANSLFGFAMSSQTNIDWPVLLTISSLGIGGLIVGQKFSSKISEQNLKKAFGYFILAIALVLLMDQFIF